jgi:hypothetical protein
VIGQRINLGNGAGGIGSGSGSGVGSSGKEAKESGSSGGCAGSSVDRDGDVSMEAERQLLPPPPPLLMQHLLGESAFDNPSASFLLGGSHKCDACKQTTALVGIKGLHLHTQQGSLDKSLRCAQTSLASFAVCAHVICESCLLEQYQLVPSQVALFCLLPSICNLKRSFRRFAAAARRILHVPALPRQLVWRCSFRPALC